MSDAISHSRKHQKSLNEARQLTCMYFGIIPFKGQITLQYIELWLEKYGRTPESMKQELEDLGLMWWIESQGEGL
jgi:hypothetical protein